VCATPILVDPTKLTVSKPRDEVYGAYDPSYLQTSMPTTHTQSPAVTGTSVLGVKYNGGVVVAADNLGMTTSEA
jgi:20S proteasome subunit beta 7